MDLHIPPVIKNHWPIVVGGVLGVGLLIYMSRSGSSSETDPTAAWLAAQANAGAANQSYSLAQQSQDAQIALAQTAANTAAAAAQGQTAIGLVGASAEFINSLNAPAVAAIGAAAAENAVSINSSVASAIAGYSAAGSMLQSTAGAASAYSATLAANTNALAAAVAASQAGITSQVGSVATAKTGQPVNQGNNTDWAKIASTAAMLLV